MFTEEPSPVTVQQRAGHRPTALRCLQSGADFVLIGRGAMLCHDFARRALADPGFQTPALPVTRAHLAAEGLGPAFLQYVASTWPNFMANP